MSAQHYSAQHDSGRHDPAGQQAAGTYLTPAQLARDLAIPDLSDPADGPHAIQLITGLAVSGLVAAWRGTSGGAPAVRWCRGPRIVSIADNYDNLGYPPAAVTRAARYTRYVDGQRMLRAHATALVPPALRQLAAGPPADVLLACPGISYRRDAIDWQHTGTPHQLDLWRISTRQLGPAGLEEMIAALLAAVLPGRPSRQVARVHPYTMSGRQIDVRHGDRWVEVGECGLAHPAVLARAGLAGCTGLAIGLGLDRLLMLVKGIGDIRLLRSADPRVAVQLQDLAPYRRVSRLPALRRDLSVAVSADDDEETLGDRVRDALGPDADVVEEVAVLSAAGAADLPPAAIRRLGLQPGQRNLLVRVVLRPLAETLTDARANELRDRIYLAIHLGSERQLASR
jgi:phenylalanyl-tRNA synthetase alpha chain